MAADRLGDSSTKGDSSQETEYDKIAGVLSCLIIFFLEFSSFGLKALKKLGSAME